MSAAYLKHFRGALTSMFRIRAALLNCTLCFAAKKNKTACLQASAGTEYNINRSGFKETP
jgi:hypothetical protein